MRASIKARLTKLENLNRDPLEALEHNNPVSAVMRAAYERARATPGYRARQAEFDELLGPIQRPPPTGHAGIEPRNYLAARWDALGASPHRDRLFELMFDMWDIEYDHLWPDWRRAPHQEREAPAFDDRAQHETRVAHEREMSVARERV